MKPNGRGKASRERYRAKMKASHDIRAQAKSSRGAHVLFDVLPMSAEERADAKARYPVVTVPWAAANRSRRNER